MLPIPTRQPMRQFLRLSPFCITLSTRHPDAIERAVHEGTREDEVLGGKIQNALALEKEGMETETALLKIGNDVSVFQTLPIAFFLINRYQRPADLLTVSANTGGNTDTIAFLCGAYLGASRGMDASLPICSQALKTGSGSRFSASGSIMSVPGNWKAESLDLKTASFFVLQITAVLPEFPEKD